MGASHFPELALARESVTISALGRDSDAGRGEEMLNRPKKGGFRWPLGGGYCHQQTGGSGTPYVTSQGSILDFLQLFLAWKQGKIRASCSD